MNKLVLFLMMSSLFFTALPSYAYIGPGMGGGVIAITLGFFAAIFLALFGILYYPIKRVIKKRRNQNRNFKKKSNDES